MAQAPTGTLEVTGTGDDTGSSENVLLGIKRTLAKRAPHLPGSTCPFVSLVKDDNLRGFEKDALGSW